MVQFQGVTPYAFSDSWSTLDKPGAHYTVAGGTNGEKIVGSYYDSFGHHGFIYDGKEWSDFTLPEARFISAENIYGNTIVGTYQTPGYDRHGFTLTIPEPETLILLGLGVLALRKKRNKTT